MAASLGMKRFELGHSWWSNRAPDIAGIKWKSKQKAMLKVNISLFNFKLVVQISLNLFKNFSIWRINLNPFLLG